MRASPAVSRAAGIPQDGGAEAPVSGSRVEVGLGVGVGVGVGVGRANVSVTVADTVELATATTDAGTVVVEVSTASAVCPSAVCVTMHVAPAGTAGRVTTRVVPAGVPAASVPEFSTTVVPSSHRAVTETAPGGRLPHR